MHTLDSEQMTDSDSIMSNHLCPNAPSHKTYIKHRQATPFRNLWTTKEYKLLKREAKTRAATVDIQASKDYYTLFVEAPKGAIWANNEESTLTHDFVYSSREETLVNLREAVAALIHQISQGFSKISENHDESCECETCEAYDSEVEDLDF